MKRETLRGAVYFLFFFWIGLGFFILSNGWLTASNEQMAANEEKKEGGSRSISEIAALVSPSIVGITNLSRTGDFFSQRQIEQTGSGVIIDKEGHIVTNNHVIAGAERLVVTLADGNEEEAKLVGADPRTDLAVIKIKVDNRVTPAVLGDSSKLAVGQEVIAIGNPLGLRFARSVTAGIVSGLNRLLTTEEGFTYRLIQTDAAINPGNSGGALVNMSGEVVGINTVKIAAEGFEGMGFSIPSNQVKNVVNDIKKYGRVLRPLMGIRILGEIGKDEARYYDLPVEHGVVVEPVLGGPAQRAGMKKYDIVTKIDGKDIETGIELQEEIFSKKIGQTVKVEIVRIAADRESEPEKKNLNVTLSD